MTDSGLPGVLFRILDTETDKQLIKDVHDTLTSMLQMLAADNISQWLSLCRGVLTVTSGSYCYSCLVTANLIILMLCHMVKIPLIFLKNFF